MKLFSLIFLCSLMASAGTCTSGVNSRTSTLGVTLSSCKYVDYTAGSDSNTGDDESHPWKHSPGMTSWTTSTASPTDGCSSNCAAYNPTGSTGIIFKGGTVWPYTVFPFIGCGGYTPAGGSCSTNWNGTGSTDSYGCTGSGCLYWGVDPTWNHSTLVGITITRDLGGCSSTPSVTLSGGGASVQATAHAVMVPGTASFFTGFMEYIAIDTPGSGYTSNPTVSITGGTGCNAQTAVADITRAVFDFGNGSYIWSNTSGNAWAHGPFWQFSNNAVWDSLEVRNLNTAMAVVNAFGNYSQTSLCGSKSAITNFYSHGMVESSVSNGNEDMDLLNANCAGPHEVSNSFISDGDSVYIGPVQDCPANGPCVWGSGGMNMVQGYYHDNHVSWTRWQFRGGAVTAGQVFILANNEAWLNTYSCCGGHVNDMYLTVSSGATGYNYGNFTHDDVGGSSNQLPQSDGAQWYIFNNLRVSVGGGSPAWGIDTVTGATPTAAVMHFYNNTIANVNTAASTNSGQGECLNGTTGPYVADLTVTVQNNHCINVPNAVFSFASGITAQTQAGLTGEPNLEAAQIVMTTTQATSQGYVYTNLYAPGSPTNDTVTFSGLSTTANLTPLCTGSLTPLCSDINGHARPSSGGWEAGAYQYTSGVTGSSFGGSVTIGGSVSR